MTIGNMIYKLIIGPLELLFEVIFTIANRNIKNPGLSIIFLSLTMNLLVLPLYKRADAIQEEERSKTKLMQPWVEHIRKTFSGDERYMILQTYYRQNNYKQTDVLKGSIPLMLEVPFFIAAYNFLSHLRLLQGISFGPINDLGSPDGLIAIGGLTINLLPILMTAINAASASIYMKGMPLKSKVQMYGMAAVFLVLLYDSPSGLVFYWTLNNVFSLVKNIFSKVPSPEKLLRVIISILSAVGLIFVLFVHPMKNMRVQIITIVLLLLLQVPTIVSCISGKTRSYRMEYMPECGKWMLISGLCLTIICGIYIPSSVIRSSVEEFIEVGSYLSPIWYIVAAFLTAAGFFLVWLRIFYMLATKESRIIISLISVAAAIISYVDYSYFGRNYGNMSSILVYDEHIAVPSRTILINIAAIAIICLALAVTVKFLPKVLTPVIGILCLIVSATSILNVTNINKELKASQDVIKLAADNTPELVFSRENRNVIVLMLDRACGYYLPYILNEVPGLKEELSGFTFYPNTVSFGSKTNIGSPGLYGGYEYTPEKINERSDLLLADKQNEALKVMPVLFDRNKFTVTVCDPTYAGYTWIPDLSIYDEYPNIKKYITLGKFSLEEYGFTSSAETNIDLRMRNFFCYSFFRSAPVILQPTLYAGGEYNISSRTDLQNGGTQIVLDNNSASGYTNKFMNTYAVLSNLKNISSVDNNAGDTFLMMSNDTTHEPMLLQEPEYEPSWKVDNSEFESADWKRTDENGNEIYLKHNYNMREYHVNMAAILKLGEWFTWMKENGIYDNTRIIIVADHGQDFSGSPIIGFKTSKEDGDGAADGMNIDAFAFNALFMYKDFNSQGPIQTDQSFMTVADTPSIAMNGIINNPINPFTGKAINQDASIKSGKLHLQYTKEWNTTKVHGNRFAPGYWFTVQKNIFDKNNWEYLGYY